MKKFVLFLSITALTLAACGESDPPPMSREEALKDKPPEAREDTPPKAPPPSKSETVDLNSGQVIPGFSGGHMGLEIGSAERVALTQAIKETLEVIKQDPNNLDAYWTLASAYQDLREYDKAIAAYQKIVELDPDNLDAYTKLGILHTKQNDHNAALEVFRKVVELDPNSAEAYNSLGLALDRTRKYKEAIVAYQKAIELDPSDAKTYDALGRLLLNHRRADEGFAAFRKSLELKPSARKYKSLGSDLSSKRRYDQAVAAYRMALQLDRDDPETYDRIARTLLNHGKVAEADAEYRNVRAVDPDYYFSASIFGHARLLDLHELEALLREAITRYPESERHYDELSRTLQKQGRTAEAEVVRETARELWHRHYWEREEEIETED